VADAKEQALTVVERLTAGRFADLIDFFTPRLREVLSADEISGGWAVMRKMHGDVGGVGSPTVFTAGDGTILVRVPLTCERGGFVVAVSIDTEEHRLAGLRMVSDDAAPTTSPWVPASYVDPWSFTERQVTIGAGPLQVSGFQTLPRRSRPARAVVLLGGSGPSDRDGTIRTNKPLKDLAWGLGSLEIATLRYDKVTYAHATKLVEIPILRWSTNTLTMLLPQSSCSKTTHQSILPIFTCSGTARAALSFLGSPVVWRPWLA
jgi:uncharacterized protein